MATKTAKRKPIIGVVLAGGQSSRMGTDKALLHIDAQTMITRTANVLRDTSVDRVVISRNTLTELSNTTTNAQFADIIPHKGPLSGIHSIATRFPQYNLLVLPVDLPLMDANTIQQLIDSAAENQTNVRFKGDNLPLLIQNTPSFRQVLDYTLRCTDSFSVERLCSHFPIVECRVKVSSRTFNTNTPEQWRYAMQHFDNGHSINSKEGFHESFK